jgi:uncharacterized membrane protein
MIGRAMRIAPFALAAVLIAVVVHVLSVLSMPALAMRTSSHLLASRLGTDGSRLLPPARPGAEPTPFADPAMVTALCAFDISEGPFRMRAAMTDAFTAMTVLSDRGVVVHGLTDKAATRRQLDVVLVTEQQLRILESQDPEDRPPPEIRLRMSVLRGVIVLRGLAPRASDVAAVTDVLSRTQCMAVGDG